MGFADLDSVTTTDMQSWGFTPTTPYSKTEQLFQVETIVDDEVVWIPEWNRWNNYYRTIPEFAAQINTSVLWIAGLGWTANAKTTKILERIRGNGVDIFDTVITNLITEYKICGDAFGEIIRRMDGTLINLKPLIPRDIKIVGNAFGQITRYELIASTADEQGNFRTLKEWSPDEIFHLSWNRVANEIHGIPSGEKLEQQMKKINLAKDITAVIHRRHMTPVIIWEIDEDDKTKAAAFKVKVDNIYQKIENIIVPMGAAKATILQMQKGSVSESIEWIQNLQMEFTKAGGVPNVAQGSETGSSEATSKIVHLNFQPRASYERLFLEKQIKAQLNLEVKFKEPPSIDPALLTDARKNTGKDVKDVGVSMNES